MHRQLIVSRKTADNGRLISPMTNDGGSNAGHNQKFGQFDRLDFTERCEKAFDRTFSYERELTEMFQYRKVMLNGTVMERAEIIVAERNHQENKPRSRARLLSRKKEERKSWRSSLKSSHARRSRKSEVSDLVCDKVGYQLCSLLYCYAFR
jgi:hypothetical protein